MEWSFFFNGSTLLKKNKNPLKYYKYSYSKFYKKKLLKIRYNKYMLYFKKKLFNRNKEEELLNFREMMIDFNPDFDIDFKEKEINLLYNIYNSYILRYLRKMLYKRPLALIPRSKFYNSYRKSYYKKKRLDIKKKKRYLHKYLNEYCNKIIKTENYNKYYNKQFLQLNNKFLLYKKQILNKSKFFIKKF